MADWETQADVVVVGSGFAGLAAAIEAAEAGAFPVTIIEKMPTPGGNSIYNAGQIAAVGSKQQLASSQGQHDSSDLMVEDMMKSGLEMNHAPLLRKMIEKSKDTLEWTEKEFGVKYRDRVIQSGGHSVPRTLSTIHASGRDIIDPMLQRVRHHPSIHLLLSTKLEKIITSPKTGAVQAIKVADTVLNESFELKCKRGLVLAAGGFSSDIEFRSIQNPSLHEDVQSTNQSGSTAEVLKQAMKVGAMSVQLSRIQLGPWTSPDERGFGQIPYFCIGAGFPHGILIDPRTSVRFVNELENRYELSRAILKLGQPAICITDSNGAKHSLKTKLKELYPALHSYETLTHLVEAFGLDEEVLLKVLEVYNADVAVGRDSAFGKPLREDAKPIIEPPFYAARLWPKVHYCMGGLQIDEDAQVMHIDGHPIKGLYAAGEITGGIHGADRLEACATLDCLTFGRIAGRNAATRGDVPKEGAGQVVALE